MVHAGESTVIKVYLPRLVRLAERNLSPSLKKKVDSEDISASVLRSVIRKSRNGLIIIEESEDFWKQLVVITLNKVRKKARYWTAAKRSIAKEVELVDGALSLEQLAKLEPDLGEPDDEDGEAFIETIEKLNSRLDETCQRVLAMKIEGLTHEAIAEQLERSTKTVGRCVNTIKLAMKEMHETDG